MADPLFDDEARALRRRRAQARDGSPFLAERIVEEMVERLMPVRRNFRQALVTGCPTGLRPRLADVAEKVRFADQFDALAAEEEQGLDLLLTVGELDVLDELPLLLRIAWSRLAPSGLFAGAIVGGNSLPALRAALHAADRAVGGFAPRTHPRIEASAFAGLLGAAGFVDPVVDIDRVRLSYGSMSRLVADLRDHAATNILRSRPRQSMSRSAVAAAEQAFAARAEGGATEERIELIHFAAWIPASKQP
ncbi:hypothetical protein GCM10022280_16990 [Sphingomonas swuensis]|uniref:Methyltransferase n=1 Tax=Sphingomonas swuensis TaxID=977800 RepID=A0ABP7SZ84_9SPHN